MAKRTSAYRIQQMLSTGYTLEWIYSSGYSSFYYDTKTKSNISLYRIQLKKGNETVDCWIDKRQVERIEKKYSFNIEKNKAEYRWLLKINNNYFYTRKTKTAKGRSKGFCNLRNNAGYTVSGGKSTDRVWKIAEISKCYNLDSYKTYLSAQYNNSESLQFSSYIGRAYRNDIVVDVDSFLKRKDKDYIETTKEFIEKMTSLSGIKKPSVITVNNANGHLQLHWILDKKIEYKKEGEPTTVEHHYEDKNGEIHFQTTLDYNSLIDTVTDTSLRLTEKTTDKKHPCYSEPATAKEVYLGTMRGLSYIFGGDPNATGGNYKNIFCNGNKEADLTSLWLDKNTNTYIAVSETPFPELLKKIKTYDFSCLYENIREMFIPQSEEKRKICRANLKNLLSIGNKESEIEEIQYVKAMRGDFELYNNSILQWHEQDMYIDECDITEMHFDSNTCHKAEHLSRQKVIDMCSQKKLGRHNLIFEAARLAARRWKGLEYLDYVQGDFIYKIVQESLKQHNGKLPGTNHNDAMSEKEIIETGRIAYNNYVHFIKDNFGVWPDYIHSEEERKRGKKKAMRLSLCSLFESIGKLEKAGYSEQQILSRNSGVKNPQRLKKETIEIQNTISGQIFSMTHFGKQTKTISRKAFNKMITSRAQSGEYFDPYCEERDPETYRIIKNIENTDKGKKMPENKKKPSLVAFSQYSKESLLCLIRNSQSKEITWAAIRKYIILYCREKNNIWHKHKIESFLSSILHKNV